MAIFFLAIFLFFTGYESVYYIAKKILNPEFSETLQYKCPEENKTDNEKDGKEGEKEGEKEIGKECIEILFAYQNLNSSSLTKSQFFRQSRLALSTAGYSGEIFSPPELLL